MPNTTKAYKDSNGNYLIATGSAQYRITDNAVTRLTNNVDTTGLEEQFFDSFLLATLGNAESAQADYVLNGTEIDLLASLVLEKSEDFD